MSYRTNAKPAETPPKKPLLCRIGIHFWGGWALDGCGVFFCMRCDRYFVCSAQKDPCGTPDIVFTRREVAVRGRSCEGWGLIGSCTATAQYVVRVDGDALLLCPFCVDRALWEEGPNLLVKAIQDIVEN